MREEWSPRIGRIQVQRAAQPGREESASSNWAVLSATLSSVAIGAQLVIVIVALADDEFRASVLSLPWLGIAAVILGLIGLAAAPPHSRGASGGMVAGVSPPERRTDANDRTVLSVRALRSPRTTAEIRRRDP